MKKKDDGMRDMIKRIEEDRYRVTGIAIIVFLGILFLGAPWIGGVPISLVGLFVSYGIRIIFHK